MPLHRNPAPTLIDRSRKVSKTKPDDHEEDKHPFRPYSAIEPEKALESNERALKKARWILRNLLSENSLHTAGSAPDRILCSRLCR